MGDITEKMFAVAVRDGADLFLWIRIRRAASGIYYVFATGREEEPDWKNGILTEATITDASTTKALTRRYSRRSNIRSRSRTPVFRAPSRWLRGLFHPTNPG